MITRKIVTLTMFIGDHTNAEQLITDPIPKQAIQEFLSGLNFSLSLRGWRDGCYIFLNIKQHKPIQISHSGRANELISYLHSKRQG